MPRDRFAGKRTHFSDGVPAASCHWNCGSSGGAPVALGLAVDARRRIALDLLIVDSDSKNQVAAAGRPVASGGLLGRLGANKGQQVHLDLATAFAPVIVTPKGLGHP